MVLINSVSSRIPKGGIRLNPLMKIVRGEMTHSLDYVPNRGRPDHILYRRLLGRSRDSADPLFEPKLGACLSSCQRDRKVAQGCVVCNLTWGDCPVMLLG